MTRHINMTRQTIFNRRARTLNPLGEALTNSQREITALF
jgi:hypothetical protein